MARGNRFVGQDGGASECFVDSSQKDNRVRRDDRAEASKTD